MNTLTLTFSQIKTIKTFCDTLDSTPDYKDVIVNILENIDDFEVDNVRFISNNVIIPVMVDEIFGDDYILGCFNASFIAENTSLPIEMIEACQESEAFEAIGKGLNAIMSQEEKESFCEAYAGADGYGYHFNGYDFGEDEIIINGSLYHVFDNH